MHSYSLIAFDFDGTLVDSRDAIVTSLQDAFAEIGLEQPSRVSVLESMGRPMEKTVPILTGGVLTPEKETELVRRFREIYLINSARDLMVYPGIMNLLARLKDAGKLLGIVTSKATSAALENSRQVGMAEYFTHTVGAHDVKLHKPDPEPLRVLCERFGRPMDSEVIVIGDALFDIEMANNAGVHSCAVTWGARDEAALREVNPTYIARTAAELTEILCGT